MTDEEIKAAFPGCKINGTSVLVDLTKTFDFYVLNRTTTETLFVRIKPKTHFEKVARKMKEAFNGEVGLQRREPELDNVKGLIQMAATQYFECFPDVKCLIDEDDLERCAKQILSHAVAIAVEKSD